MRLQTQLRRWLRRLPKAELHVHLEGTIEPATYCLLARSNGLSAADPPESAFACSSFQSFLEAFMRVTRVLQKPEDFALVARQYLQSCARQGVRHVELMMSPGTQRAWFPRLDVKAVVRAVHEACVQARLELGISSLLIFDIVRNLGESAGFQDLNLALECRHSGVVGIGLGGDERCFPARDFADVFKAARQAGLCRTVHAGEAAGPESVLDAIRLLYAQRIGHGVAAAGQSPVLELLRARNVTLDVCPSSNAVTNACQPGVCQPLLEFVRCGVQVSLNSDDPAFFKTTVFGEYEKAAAMGLSSAELVRIARAGFASSFASDDDKRKWIAELEDYVEEAGTPDCGHAAGAAADAGAIAG